MHKYICCELNISGCVHNWEMAQELSPLSAIKTHKFHLNSAFRHISQTSLGLWKGQYYGSEVRTLANLHLQQLNKFWTQSKSYYCLIPQNISENIKN